MSTRYVVTHTNDYHLDQDDCTIPIEETFQNVGDVGRTVERIVRSEATRLLRVMKYEVSETNVTTVFLPEN